MFNRAFFFAELTLVGHIADMIIAKVCNCEQVWDLRMPSGVDDDRAAGIVYDLLSDFSVSVCRSDTSHHSERLGLAIRATNSRTCGSGSNGYSKP